MFKRLKVLSIAAVAVISMAASAQAAPVIDFGSGFSGRSGSLQWHADGSFTGTGIAIQVMNVDEEGNPAEGPYLVTGLATGSRGGSYGSLDFNTSPANNFITITGCVPGLTVGTTDGNGNCTQPVALMTGTFSGYTGGPLGITASFGMDTKNQALLDAIGFEGDWPWQFFGVAIVGAQTARQGGPGVGVVSVDYRNAPVPEPATMVLLGTGLLAAFRARRREA